MADVIAFTPRPPRPSSHTESLHVILLRHCVDTVTLAGRSPTLRQVREVLMSSPRGSVDLADDDFVAHSVCWNFVGDAERRAMAGLIPDPEFERILHFWTQGFAGKEPKLRGALLQMLDLLIDAEPAAPSPAPLPAPADGVPPWARYFGHPAFPPPLAPGTE
jgi:hypothetical protein